MIVVHIVGCIVGMVLVFRLLRWISTPVLRYLGFYTYYNPMFFTMPFGTSTVEIHLGTTWDFFKQHGIHQRTMMAHVCQGLLAMVRQAQQGVLSKRLRIRGTLYFLHPKHAELVGFSVRKLWPLEVLLFAANYIEICVLLSIMRKRISTVPLSNLRVVHCTLGDLCQHSQTLEVLAEKLV
jgi:hypothetical protein